MLDRTTLLEHIIFLFLEVELYNVFNYIQGGLNFALTNNKFIFKCNFI